MSKEYIEEKRKEGIEIDDDGFISEATVEKYCKLVLNDFLKEEKYKDKKDKNVDLKNFMFGKLYYDYKYGSDGDADSGELVKIIHFLSYLRFLAAEGNERIKLKLKVFCGSKWVRHTILFSNNNNNIELSGETPNTFATLFSRKCENSLNRFFFKESKKISQKFDFIDDNSLKDFYKQFQRIGNFMLLPFAENNSINKYRAGWENASGWYDYFDLFLNAIRIFYDVKGDKTNFLQSKKDAEKLLEALEMEFKSIPHAKDAYSKFAQIMNATENKVYFNSFNTFKEFVEFNSLKAFFKNGTQYKETKKLCLNCKPHYHWMKNIDNEEYKTFAENYISVAKDIIDERSADLIK